MPALPQSRHEAFAQARAKGASLDDAYEDAGFAAGRGHGCRLAQRPDVAERIAEIRAELGKVEAARPAALIAALLRLADASEKLGTLEGIKDARASLLQAGQVNKAWNADRRFERVNSSEFTVR